MIEHDTVRLLRECDAGVQMGISAIDEVSGYVHDAGFRQSLSSCRAEHEKLQDKTRKLLDQYHDAGKAPSPMAKGMSWIKTNAKLAVDASDQTIANLMTDGCNMGVKSLSRFLNQYAAADEKSKDITKRLIQSEEKLALDIRRFL